MLRQIVLALLVASAHAFVPRAGVAPTRRRAGVTAPSMNVLESLLGLAKKTYDAPCVMGEEEIMSPKAHGTSPHPVQDKLRWNIDRRTADRICSFNRHYAENAGYYETTSYLMEVSRERETVYYDSVTGKPLFVAPRG